MPKEELVKFIRSFAKEIISRELRASGIDEEVIANYEVVLTDQDYLDLEQKIFNQLVQYGMRVLN